MRLLANLALALCVAISFIAPSLGHAHQARRHHVHRQGDLARRDPGEINLYKRFDGTRLTYYAVGLGACGQVNVPTDFIVALDSAQFDSGSYCFQMITITANGRTTQAQIMDRCPGCPVNGLDLSEGLFQFFGDLSLGVLTGSWNFGSGGSAPSPSPSPSPPPPPPSPTTSVNTPLTSWIPSPTTSQPPPTTTSASSAASSSGTSFTSHSLSNTSSVATQTTSNTVAVTAGAVPGGAGDASVLFDLDLSIVYIGLFLGACKGAQ